MARRNKRQARFFKDMLKPRTGSGILAMLSECSDDVKNVVHQVKVFSKSPLGCQLRYN